MYKLLYVAYELRLFMLQLLESQVNELQQVIDNDEVSLSFICLRFLLANCLFFMRSLFFFLLRSFPCLHS